MKKIKALLILPCLLILGSNAFSQTMQNANQNVNTVVSSQPKQEVLTMEKAINDHGYPSQKNSGNADADYADYKKAKTDWIAKNPELYKKMFANSNPATVSGTLRISEKREERK